MIDSIKTLKKMGDKPSIGSLIESLKDEDYDVREAAYQSLRKIGHPAMAAMIQALNNDNFYVRMYAALAIADQAVECPEKKYSDSVIDALTHALLDKSIYVRRSAYDALRFIEYNKILRSLINTLDDADYGLIISDVAALGDVPDKMSAKALMKKLSMNEVEDKGYSISMQGIRDRKAALALLELLFEHDGSVRKETLRAMDSTGNKKSLPDILRSLRYTKPPVKHEAIKTLDCISSFKHAAPFIDGQSDPDSYVRKAVVISLGKAKGKKSIEPLMRALEDEDMNVRKAAQQALARMGDRSLKPLMEALNDQNDLRKYGAARALELMSKARSKKELSQKLEPPEVWMEIEAAISAYSRERQASLTSFDTIG